MLLSYDELKAKIGAGQQTQVIRWLNEHQVKWTRDAKKRPITNLDLINRRIQRRGESWLVLVRGLPGCGKTTTAKRDYPGHDHFEADMYFQSDGEYVFDKSRLSDAHQWCLQQTREALESGRNVVVANTFTTHAEMKPYFDLGYQTSVVLAQGGTGSIHGVPNQAINRMVSRWQPYEAIRDGML